MDTKEAHDQVSSESGSQLCFRVSRDVKRVWDSLKKGEKITLTNFFREAIASFPSTKTLLLMDVKNLSDFVELLRAGYEACRVSLDDFRDKLKRLRTAVCTLIDKDEMLRQELEKRGLSELCR